jgi:hypothetical protein
VLADDDLEKLDKQAMERVDAAVEFADNSPFPELDSLYDDIYVYGDQVQGWYSVDERAPEPHRGERERESGDVAHELAEAGAAYAGVGDAEERARRSKSSDEGEGEPADDDRDQEGGAD